MVVEVASTIKSTRNSGICHFLGDGIPSSERGYQFLGTRRLPNGCFLKKRTEEEMTNSKQSLQRIMLVFLALLSAATMCVAEEKVSVDLYYESLCPYSANFIVNYLDKFFTDGLIEIVDLRLIPYGNAMIGPNLTTTCQHGPYECMLNTIEGCAIDLWPNSKQHFPFIYCVESFVLENKETEWATCFGKTDLDFKLVANCYESEYGKKLDLEYAEETNNLQPPHQYVPWVVVNGQPLYEDYEDVVEYVCTAYKGTLPQACVNLSVIRSSARKKGMENNSHFCLKEALINPM